MKRFIAALLILFAHSGWATVYYVRPTNGSDAAAGTSFANAWKTFQYALDNVAGNDEIRLCAEAVETPTATVDIDGTYNSFSQPLFITGASSVDGSVDGSIYTISGSSLSAGVNLITVGAAADFVSIQNVRFTAGKQYNIACTSSIILWSFNNCQFDNAVSHGIYTDQGNNYLFVDCEFNNNGGGGAVASGTTKGFGSFMGCSFHDNTTYGLFDSRAPTTVVNCLFYDNGGVGFKGPLTYGVTNVIGCVFAFNDSHGAELDGTGPACIRNNVFRSNGGYGIYSRSNMGYDPCRFINDYNCFSNNTSGSLDAGSIGANSITSDPKFTSETDGAEDFTPQSGSPLLGAGIDGGQW